MRDGTPELTLSPELIAGGASKPLDRMLELVEVDCQYCD
jgi:hypothetical protein